MNLPPWLSALLWPASLLYGGAVRLRAWLYRVGIFPQRRLNGMVISVGNLTVGGTGKTPMVMWIADRLLDEGRKVAILTRGYAGTPESSDEARLYLRRYGQLVRLGVGPSRHSIGQALAADGMECFVLDDGFQHLQLRRDVDIVLVDSTDPIERARLLPAGRLREPLSALQRAHIAIITRGEGSAPLESWVRRSVPHTFHARPALLDVIERMPGGQQRFAEGWRARKVFAFCGIGNPAAFQKDLATWGFLVAGRRVFRDHHRYTPQDLQEVERRAQEQGADSLVCTEKDAQNMGDLSSTSLPLFIPRISLQVTDPEALWAVIRATAQRSREAQS